MTTSNSIRTFYEAFARLDAEAMAACYSDDVVFEDPAFGELHGERARNMWRMLCASQKGKDFSVTHGNIAIDGDRGSATWEAVYTYTPTGRKVHNHIRATFVLKEGLIVRHTDHFDLWCWSRQALGWQGWLFGWSNWFRLQMKRRTGALLDRFEART